MSMEPTRLAKSRLSLGIINVGFWVAASVLGLWWLSFEAKGLGLLDLAILGALAFAVQAVFDFAGGYWLVPGPRPPIGTFFSGWLRGVGIHVLVLCGLGVLSVASFVAVADFSLGVILGMLALAVGRRQLLKWIAKVGVPSSVTGNRTVLLADVSDPAFTGGIAGLGCRASSVMPASWENLPRIEREAEQIRREWQIENGLHDRAFLLLLCWNVAGALAGSILFRLAGREVWDALVLHACWMTLWTFASLLVLPALSGAVVYAADRAAAQAGVDPSPWIERFPHLTSEDGNPNPALQTIFYPIPSKEMRIRALAGEAPSFVAGNLARNNLYYSWSVLTPLGRAVHCNVGRPSLWVYPPSA
jgi:hypothetical protein